MVHKLVDELVWYYPSVVLARGRAEGKAQAYAERALRLADVVSRILDLAPLYKWSWFADTKDPKPMRRFDKAFIQQRVRLCGDLFKRSSSDLLNQDVPAYVRAALRSIVTAGGNRKHRPDDDSLIWRWRFGWDDTHDQPQVFKRLIDYLEHCWREEDSVGMGDALLVTSDIWRLGSDVQKAAFLDILIFSLGADSIRLRHIALRVAYDNRDTLSTAENTRNAEFGEKLLTNFSQALLAAITLDSTSVEVTSDGSDSNQDPADVKSNDESDPHFHRQRDEHYLRLIFTLANSSDWIPSIARNGHLDRCLLLLERESSDYLHLAIIFLQIEASGCLGSSRLNAITEEQWRTLTTEAWENLHWHDDDLNVCVEALPALAERTIGLSSSTSWDSWVRESVAEVHGHLKQQCVKPEIWSAVGKLLKKIDER